MSVYKTGLTIAMMTALASGAAFAASSGDLEGKAAVNTKYPNELSAQAQGSIPGPTSSTTRAEVSQEGQNFKKSPVTEDGWRESNGEVGATPDRQNLARSSSARSRNQAAVKSQGTNSSYPNDKAGSTPSTMRGSPDAAATSDSSMSGGVGSSAPSSTYGGVNTAQ